MSTEPVLLTIIRSHRETSPPRVSRSAAAVLALRISVLLLMLMGIAIAPRVARADITYNVVDYPSLESGYTISGTITTDGKVGTGLITAGGIVGPPGDILNFDITISNSNGPVETFSLADAASIAGTTFTATPTELIVDPAVGDDIGFQLPNFDYVVWTAQGQSWVTYAYGGFFGPNWRDAIGDPFIVATAPAATPEPATVTLLGAGVLTLGAFRLRRRRRTMFTM